MVRLKYVVWLEVWFGKVKGTVHSSNIWTKSLANGLLMIVLLSRFSPNMPVGPVILKLVSYRSIILGSIIIIFGSIIIILGSIITIFGSIIIILGSIIIIFGLIVILFRSIIIILGSFIAFLSNLCCGFLNLFWSIFYRLRCFVSLPRRYEL